MDFIKGTLIKSIEFLCRPFSSKKLHSALSVLLKGFGNGWNSYVSYVQLPKSSTDINYASTCSNNNEEVGIVLQGPVIEKEDFTIETIRLYKKIFPGAKIIVSTWIDTDERTVLKIEREEAFVVLNEKPHYSGTYNINYQVVSTMGGLRKAEELNCKYCMKTRADQRIYRFNLLPYIYSLQQQFPLSAHSIEGQQERIFFYEGNHPSSLLIPYEICDFFFYGRTEDLISYFDYNMTEKNWTCEEYDNFVKHALNSGMSGEEYHASTAPEVLLLKDYLQRHHAIRNEIDSMSNYWNLISSSFLALSFEDLELYWFKNVTNNNISEFKNLFKIDLEQQSEYYYYTWSFRNWLSLFNGLLKVSDNVKYISKLPLSQSKLL